MTLASPAFRYTWLLWAAAFLLPWALLFITRPALRRPMLWVSTNETGRERQPRQEPTPSTRP